MPSAPGRVTREAAPVGLPAPLVVVNSAGFVHAAYRPVGRKKDCRSAAALVASHS